MAPGRRLGYGRPMVRRRLKRYGYPLLGLLFLAAAGAEIASDDALAAGEAIAASAAAFAVAVAVAQADREPLVLAALVLATFVLRPVVPEGGEGAAYGIPVILAPYACALELEGRRRVAGALLCTAIALHGGLYDGAEADADSLIFFALLVGAPWAAGRVVRLSRQRQSLLEDRTRLLEIQRDERARAAVAEERRRIAASCTTWWRTRSPS